MKFWQAVSFAEPEQLVDIARIAEEVGFEGVFCSDHLFFPQSLGAAYPYSEDGRPPFTPETPFPDPWVTIGAMSAVTSTLRFSVAVYILPLRNPLEVAKSTATVAVLSDNRLALGVGAGWMKEEFEQLGIDFHTRGKRFNETITVLRKLWQSGMVEHHGDFFDFDPLQMSPAPSQTIPIYVGGTSKAALRRTARLGDGWIGAGNHPDDVPPILKSLAELRQEAGTASQPFQTIVPLTTAPDPDVLRGLEDHGMTSTVSYPFAYTVGPQSSLDEKRRAMETYAETIIARTR